MIWKGWGHEARLVAVAAVVAGAIWSAPQISEFAYSLRQDLDGPSSVLPPSTSAPDQDTWSGWGLNFFLTYIGAKVLDVLFPAASRRVRAWIEQAWSAVVSRLRRQRPTQPAGAKRVDKVEIALLILAIGLVLLQGLMLGLFGLPALP